MNPVDVAVVAQLHLNEIRDGNDRYLNPMYGQVLRPDRRIGNRLSRSDPFAAKDEVNRVACLRLAVVECDPSPVCDFLDPLQIRPMHHDVDIFCVPHGGRFDPVDLDHHGVTADQLVRDLFGGKWLGDSFQGADECKQAFFEQ